MSFSSFFQSSSDDFHAQHHKGSFTHDALAGAVGYEAAKAYEDHLAANGQPDSHAKAKELFAGFAAAAVTQFVSTKGLDTYDSYKQREVAKKASERFSERYDETITVDESSY